MLHGQLWVGKGDVVLSVKGLGTSKGPHGLVNLTLSITFSFALLVNKSYQKNYSKTH